MEGSFWCALFAAVAAARVDVGDRNDLHAFDCRQFFQRRAALHAGADDAELQGFTAWRAREQRLEIRGEGQSREAGGAIAHEITSIEGSRDVFPAEGMGALHKQRGRPGVGKGGCGSANRRGLLGS